MHADKTEQPHWGTYHAAHEWHQVDEKCITGWMSSTSIIYKINAWCTIILQLSMWLYISAPHAWVSSATAWSWLRQLLQLGITSTLQQHYHMIGGHLITITVDCSCSMHSWCSLWLNTCYKKLSQVMQHKLNLLLQLFQSFCLVNIQLTELTGVSKFTCSCSVHCLKISLPTYLILNNLEGRWHR